MWLRTEGRLFGVVFVLFNVLLAIFNVLNYKVTSRTTVPCVVIVAPTPAPPQRKVPPTPLRQRVAPVPTVTISPSLSWTETIGENASITTPHTRKIDIRNATEKEVTLSANVSSVWDSEQRDKYTIVKRYIPAEGPEPGYEESVTLCTQGTYEFLQHVPVLCERWEGPVSVSVYAPGTDLPVAIRKIIFLRNCGPPCVRVNVTWHLVFETSLAPEQLESPWEAGEMADYEPLDCSAGTKPLQLISEIRGSKKLPYPINVARNVARHLARTKYVLASDIELYPSSHIVPRFLRLVNHLDKENEGKQTRRHVFTLPIFEIKKEFPAPKTKAELVKRVRDSQAIFFHKWVCDACQNFPRRDEWVKTIPEEDSLGVFHSTKRQIPRTAWEPIYIGTNEEPFYDERLTWEGKRDKMSQMFELCLLDYDFYILDNAFLVHAPGIKTLSTSDQRRRAPFMHKNNAVHNKLLAQMKKKYGPRKGC
ncbi:beta-1,4-glucuronyltransferase 1 isoform X2 [Parasteatoda tepidariorum]|nr:beta-1,4-glucuronyltransferase 1 isoform X2 [Parasteatoda tepidariorum]XP_042907895.1 beta-1,4-glucuronyltransferase 1 isoform X2 [Parasteatoda tepidariorum]XP_042907896.1 beta-1,4-glucuronyltransferase 1 isoform X2 [Parasteatoda tepidariorum]XP_042907897.1 beta-1,4-glucuronyltransferase 1 isoform X2 [Parasteatoda tepidariorum]XP_042907898.1 beta-1,4-glucuronyltransferase 1 isoform X2 [Parasteatoda tepidariorum]